MKLTEDDLKDSDLSRDNFLVKQILENQEIVERLKTQIKYWNACGEFAVDYPDWFKYVNELQSILKGDKK